MRNYRPLITALLLIVAVLPVTILFEVKSTQGQSQDSAKPSKSSSIESRVKPSVLIRDPRTEPAAKPGVPSSNVVSVAARNWSLQNELEWEFGGKQQRGWYLYVPLIRHLLKTQNDVDTQGFALALEQWQKKSGLTPTSVLDKDTLYSMISEWQRLRLKERGSADPNQLLTAPPSDFYDPSRPDELRQVEKKTYAAYKRMVAAAVADSSLGLIRNEGNELAPAEKFLRIVSAYRSPEYQEQLRRKSPQSGRAGLAVNSPHFTGRALDLYVGGDPVETKDSNRAVQIQTRVYRWLINNAERFGFRPYFYEPWHWEYVEGGSRQ